MLKKIMLIVTVVVLLVAAENMIAQDSSNRTAARPTQRARRGMGMQERGMRGGQGQFGMMQDRFGTWFDDLAKAYENNDKEKMGQLIDDMKQRRERMQRGMGMAGPDGGRRPEGMGRPGQGPPMMGRGDTLSTENPPLSKSEAEKKILNILDDMDKNQRRGMMNVPIEDGRLLRLLAEAVSAKHVVEIGTSNGYSGIWFCLALRKTDGRLTTYEIDARRASLARENFKRAGVDKLVTLVEGDAHKEVTKLKGSVDLVFIDADKEGYTDYLKKLSPLVRPGGLIVAHNIRMRGGRSGIGDYVKAVTNNPDMETIFYEQGGGVSVTLKKR